MARTSTMIADFGQIIGGITVWGSSRVTLMYESGSKPNDGVQVGADNQKRWHLGA